MNGNPFTVVSLNVSSRLVHKLTETALTLKAAHLLEISVG